MNICKELPLLAAQKNEVLGSFLQLSQQGYGNSAVHGLQKNYRSEVLVCGKDDPWMCVRYKKHECNLCIILIVV